MNPREPIIVEQTDNTLTVVVLAVVIVAILAVTTALVIVNMDIVREPGSGAQDNPSNPPTAAPPENDLLPTVPPVPTGFLPQFAAT